jgi:DNA polymerase-1
LEGFHHGKDIHQQTTDNIAALDGRRAFGKECNFALFYNCSATRLNSEFPDFSVSRWQTIKDGFFDYYRGAPVWHSLQEAILRKDREVCDLFGRKRRFLQEDINEKFWSCKNQAINFPPQASATNLMLLCMIKIQEEWLKEGLWGTDVGIVHMIHDELIIEVDESIAERVALKNQEIMENTIQLDVPIRAEYTIADNWAEGK